MSTSHQIYLDNASSTPVKPGVLEAMLPFLQNPGNPHTRHHTYGQSAAKAIEVARGQIASAIKVETNNIIFTSGATEANNLALKGMADYLRSIGKTHIISSKVEHKSILAPLADLEKHGLITITLISPKPCGMVEADMIEKEITPQTGLVSIQAVNNELGTIQPLSEISEMLRGKDILFHSDAAQALGKMSVNIDEMGVDLMSLSSHKAYGPQGVGALYVRSAVKLEPLLHGGGQETGLRSGTLPTALCVGFGYACSVLEDRRVEFQKMREEILDILAPLEPEIFGHSDPAWNVPNILNLRFKGIESETLVMALPDLAFSTGSACSSQSNTLSHVISAIASQEAAREALRLSWGDLTSVTLLHKAMRDICEVVTQIKHMQEMT